MRRFGYSRLDVLGGVKNPWQNIGSTEPRGAAKTIAKRRGEKPRQVPGRLGKLRLHVVSQRFE